MFQCFFLLFTADPVAPPSGATVPEAAVDAALEEDRQTLLHTDGTIERDMSSVMATMWLGTKSGTLYVHSAIANYGRCIVG